MKHRITFVLLTMSLVLSSWPLSTSRAASGKTGAGTQVGKPFRVPAIAAGSTHSLALKSDGTVVAWGNNSNGQTNIPAGLSGVIAIAAGGYHSMALKSDGSVVAWGWNLSGQTTVPAGLSGVVAIAAGSQHSLALKSNGSVVAWGRNDYGQTTIPTAAQSGVVAIVAGGDHSLALKSNGTVVAWGNNAYGQTNVPVELSDVIAIAGGGNHSLALKSYGTVVAWGKKDNGQTAVPAGLSSVVAIAAGSDYSLATTLSADIAPTIVVTNIISEAGTTQYTNSQKANVQVATVSDKDDGISSLTVTITKLSGTNITVESLGLDKNGKLTVRVYTSCQGATKSTFTLTVTDPGGKTATGILTVTPVRSPTIAYCIPG